jgi:molybdopterin-guanine dinucleotide biosynthesis protein A
MAPPSIDVALAGIFVGGASRRMGGEAKGLLLAPSGETIVARWQRMFASLGIPSVLVGKHAAYASLGIECLEDEPPQTGPIGGLVALLARARSRRVVAVACDMPFVSGALLEKLVFHPSLACALAPKRGKLWEPLFSRFDGPEPLKVAQDHVGSGTRSLYGVLDALGAETIDLSDGELAELRDWDEPGDRLIR